MSELKAISGHEIREDIDYNTRGIDPENKEWRNYGKELCDTLYYLKSEADKVIAEKDKEIQRLENLCESYRIDCDNLAIREANAYKEIGRDNKKISHLEEERRWRKFPDEKPEWGKEVLVLDDESEHHIVRFSHDMKWISWGKMNTCESKYVKYWMPLPSAPKEVK